MSELPRCASEGTTRDPAAQAVDATEGFPIALCDLKCLLETGRSGKTVRDKASLASKR